MVLIVLLYALLAGTFHLGKFLLSYSQPIFIVGIRMSISGALLLAYHYIANKASLSIKREHFKPFLQATLLTIYIPYLLRYWGLNYLPASKACLLYNLGPFVTYFFSYLLSKEKVTAKKTLGLCIGFIGLLPIIFTSSGHITLNHGMSIFPELGILTAVTSMSYGWLIIHKLINKDNYSPSMTNGIIMFIGGSLALITSFLLEDPATYVSDPIPFIIILAIIIIVSNLICHNLYGALLKKYSPTMLSFTSFLSPVFAALYGWLFMHEVLPLHFYGSAIIIFIGLWLFYSDELYTKQVMLSKQRSTEQVA